MTPLSYALLPLAAPLLLFSAAALGALRAEQAAWRRAVLGPRLESMRAGAAAATSSLSKEKKNKGAAEGEAPSSPSSSLEERETLRAQLADAEDTVRSLEGKLKEREREVAALAARLEAAKKKEAGKRGGGGSNGGGKKK